MTDYPPPGSPPPPGPWVSTGSTGGGGAPAGAGPGWTSYAGPPPGMLGAAHKPGAMPLRPLGLGEIYDAAFRIIRHNAKATVGSAVLVAAVAMLVPVVLVAALTWTVGITYDPTDADPAARDLVGLLATYGSLFLGGLLQGLGLILVTGIVVHVTRAAAVGRRLTLGEAWAATRGRRGRLLGLALLLGLATLLLVAAYVLLVVLAVVALPTVAAIVAVVVSVPVFIAVLCWFWVRVYYLPAAVLMLEDASVGRSIARGFRLSGTGSWRLFGIALLTYVVGVVAGGIFGVPFNVAGAIGSLAAPPDYSLLVTVVFTALAQVASTAFVAPFRAAVTSLQYLDQRMRREGYDVDLMREAGILAS